LEARLWWYPTRRRTRTMSLDLQALETSFDLVAPRGDELMDEFYSRLFTAAPAVRPLFPDDMQRQKTMLLGALVLLRKSLRDRAEAARARRAPRGVRRPARALPRRRHSADRVDGGDCRRRVERRVRVGVGVGVRDRRRDDARRRSPGRAGSSGIGNHCAVTTDPAAEDQLFAALVNGAKPASGPIVLVDYDPEWPALYEREAAKIRAALGETALLIEHAGSTSVPGLAAKPIIDIVLVVPDSTDEPA